MEKRCKFICHYRSISQTNYVFQSFLKNIEMTLDKVHEENPFVISVLGDFHAKSNNWCKDDTTSHEGSMIDAVTSNYGLRQLIQESELVLFLYRPNFHHSTKFSHGIGSPFNLHPNCHQQIVFAKFILSNLCLPPYEITVWFYEKIKTELI